MSGRQVPWASWGEWQALRADLWSTDLQRQEAALQQVCAWRLRGKLPLGVDVTAHLMDVQRADADWQRSVACAVESSVAVATASSQLSRYTSADAAVAAGELPLRLRYSMPLIRLVNGISDSQQRGKVASSVAVLSDAAGLPLALVDVRHEATHNELPSLPLLRAAASSALSWLQDNYWGGQRRVLGAAGERIGSLLSILANSWQAATVAGFSCGAMAAALTLEEEEEEDVDGEIKGSYSGSEGQRVRRQTMSEIRSLVPTSFTQELLQPILDCPVLVPPEPVPAVPGASQQQLSTQQQREVVDLRAWSSAMKHLLRWYPRLRLLLLKAALQRLVAAAAPAAAAACTRAAAAAAAPLPTNTSETREPSGVDQRARAYGLWVLRLLPGGATPQHTLLASQGGKLGSPARKHGRTSGGHGAHASGAGGGGKFFKKATAAGPTATRPSLPEADDSGDRGDTIYLDGPLTLKQLQQLLEIAKAAADLPPQKSGIPVGCPEGCREGAAAIASAPSTSTAAAAANAASATSGGGGGPVQSLCTLREVITGLQRALKQAGSAAGGGGGGGGGMGKKRQKLSALSKADVASAGEADGVGKSEGAGSGQRHEEGGGAGKGDCTDADGEGNPIRRESQPQQMRQQVPQTGSEHQKPRQQKYHQQKQKRHPGLQQQPGLPRPSQRWQRCTEWSKCAIGCLPCPLNPNGRLPPLVLPPAPAASNSRVPLKPEDIVAFNSARAADPGGFDGTTSDQRAATGAATGDRCDVRAVNPTLCDNVDIEYYEEPEETDSLQGLQERDADRDGVSDRDDMDDSDGGVDPEAVDEEGAPVPVFSSLFGALLRQQQGASGNSGAAAVGFLL
ncbi:hypothetical protein VaNZ11_002953 [Volvox africanus]|uniref:Uncharacterized protein n=1 Tax=Volvox africanus TaxID=51714 RepID=A0ABQ5RUM3_9CHLO|nr:hypothetical protein VaNZ11_002953 [Volvox africanus]